MVASRRLLFVVNEAGFFLSHRLPLAQAAAKAGYEVHVAAPINCGARQRIEKEGFAFHPVVLTRRGLNPWVEWKGLYSLFKLYLKLKPSLIHHVTIKPVLYGGIAARVAGVHAVVSAITGMGYIFIARGIKAQLLRQIAQIFYRFAFGHRNSRVIFQNSEDLQLLHDMGVVTSSQSVVIRGSGVDMTEFCPIPELGGVPLVVLASRMLWDKGVGEFVEAARCLKAKGVSARYALVGDVDNGNPASISAEQLTSWQDEGVVEWWGRRDDIPNVFAKAHVICLPSYREGLPKVLIEAAACGRPIVTTNVPGCREIVRHEENGLLVPVHDSIALSEAICRLIEDSSLRHRMGTCGRNMVAAGFSIEQVVAETLAVYKQLLGTREI